MSEQVFSSLATVASLGIIFGIFLFILALWSIFWKGFALWIAARENQKPWFIILLILNTAGILEIIYIFLVSKKGQVYIEEWKKKRKEKKKSKEHSEQEIHAEEK